ncbi:MAG: ABC transporter ATP-binding protein [Proteobacteria bacterium]|nr:ABC transporter ATP-binding protein [Pseudomonadota bacterium]
MTVAALHPTSHRADSAAPLVDVAGLEVTFRTGANKFVRAVNGVDLKLRRGETLGILGESGSGKSVMLRSLLRLHPPRITTVKGKIEVSGVDVNSLAPNALQDFRGGVASMIFQDPGLALDPVYRVGDQIAETIRRHNGGTRAEARKKALSLFERVRIPSPERRLDAYPHELSGGMRQRAMIALALSCDPELLLADEPTTALDATVQIQILIILRELQRDLGLSVIFVTHDIGVAVEVADRIAVMYAGRIVEEGPVQALIRAPKHPYTIGLLSTRGHGGKLHGHRLPAIPGSPPDLSSLPPGCAFAPRCSFAAPPCTSAEPGTVDLGDGHRMRCIRPI